MQLPGIPASVLQREPNERGRTIGGARLRDVVAKIEAAADIGEYIVNFYKEPQSHSALGYMNWLPAWQEYTSNQYSIVVRLKIEDQFTIRSGFMA